MAYIDPIELLQLQVVAGKPLSPEELKRAKRKLLAEFELQGGVTIPYRGTQIDKAAALAALEQLDDPVQQERLILIHANLALKKALQEKDERNLLALPSAEKLGDADFRKYISSLLAPVYNEMLGKHVRQQNWNMVARLLNRLDLIVEWDHATAVKSLVSHLRMNLSHLKEIPTNSEVLPTWDEPELYIGGLITAFNRLPEQFQNLRNQYGSTLEDIALALAEKHNRNRVAHRVITAAANLTLDVNLAKRIQHNQLWVWNRVQREEATSTHSSSNTGSGQQNTHRTTAGSSTQGSTSNKNWTWALILGLVIFVAALRTCTTSNRYDRGIDFYEYKPPAVTLPDMFNADSILTHQVKTRIRDSVTTGMDVVKKSSDFKLPQPRFDTIFFKDLILYEQLNQITKGFSPMEGELLTPSNGEDLYKAIRRKGTTIYADSAKKWPIEFRNESRLACVLFIESLSGGDILRSIYLKPNSRYTEYNLQKTFFKIRAYYGSDIQADAITYKGKRLPAFTKDQGLVQVNNDQLDGTTGLLSLFNWGMEDFQTKAIVPNIVIFKSDFTLRQKD